MTRLPRFLPAAALALVLAVPGSAAADPPVGAPMPAFSVEDLNGTVRTQRDLVGHWTVAFVMTDKDVGDDLTAWWRRLDGVLPSSARMYTFAALNLFALVPTASVVSQARGSTPRARWNTVWLSRDGSFARSLGLAEEEVPWIFVVDPSGRVALSIHARVSDVGVNRVLAAVPSESPPAPPPAAPSPPAPAPAPAP